MFTLPVHSTETSAPSLCVNICVRVFVYQSQKSVL